MKILSAIFIFVLLFSQIALSNPKEKGLACFYDDSFHNRKTASGEKYNKNKLSAAHKTLPFGTKVRVYNPANKKFVDVVINDRGPFIKGRIIELSRKAAQQINLIKTGVAQVEITIITYNNSVAVNNKSSIKSSSSSESTNMIVKAQDMETGGLYKMQVLKLKAKGYGVQVAGYTDYQSVVQQLAVFQDNFFKGSTVFVDQKDGKPYYKIILGPLNTREEANSYCTSIKEKYKIKDAFVVNIAELAAKK